LAFFKERFEKPIIELFDTISKKKALRKKSVVRKAKKRMLAEKRALKKEQEEKEKAWAENTEYELEDTLQEEMQSGPLSVAEFTIGHSERMRKYNPMINPDSEFKKIATCIEHFHNPMRWEPGRRAGWMFLPEYLRGAVPNGYVRGREPDTNEWQRSLKKLELVKYVARQMREEFDILVPDNLQLYQSIASKMAPGTHPWGRRTFSGFGYPLTTLNLLTRILEQVSRRNLVVTERSCFKATCLDSGAVMNTLARRYGSVIAWVLDKSADRSRNPKTPSHHSSRSNTKFTVIS
jgi:hypothetical protein